MQDYLAPRLAAHSDAIYLDSRLFQRVAAIYQQRESLKLDTESLRLVEFYYKKFVHSGANLSDSDKDALKKLNEEESTLTNDFTTRLLAATKDAAYVTTDKGALAGLTDAQINAAALAAKELRRSREEQLQVIVDLRHRPDRRARRAHGVGLVDGDRRRDSLDRIDLGLVHAVEELARVGRERLDVAALSLGVERVEDERRLSGT